MLKTALLVVAALVVAPSVAYPCMNEVQLTGDEAVKMLAKAEKYLEKGQYRQARKLIMGQEFGYDEQLNVRVHDISALIELRTRTTEDDITWIVDHFKDRSESKVGKRNMRFRAWLAEAYAATGKTEEALQILADLKKRDLMPDAFAYLTLAKLSTGTERATALASCRTRAKARTVCALPPERAVAKS